MASRRPTENSSKFRKPVSSTTVSSKMLGGEFVFMRLRRCRIVNGKGEAGKNNVRKLPLRAV
jgi:hypothetical protein